MAESSADDSDSELVALAAMGDSDAVNQLLTRHEGRLKRMLRLRINPQLRSRIDESDIIQETFVDASRNLASYAKAPKLSFYLWLRHLANLKLLEVHRQHLSTEKRDARRDQSLSAGLAETSSIMLADQICGSLTAPDDAAIRSELVRMVREGLETMDSIDREVLVLRHFEQLSTSETADVLQLSKSAAGGRYLRALQRLRDIIDRLPRDS